MASAAVAPPLPGGKSPRSSVPRRHAAGEVPIDGAANDADEAKTHTHRQPQNTLGQRVRHVDKVGGGGDGGGFGRPPPARGGGMAAATGDTPHPLHAGGTTIRGLPSAWEDSGRAGWGVRDEGRPGQEGGPAGVGGRGAIPLGAISAAASGDRGVIRDCNSSVPHVSYLVLAATGGERRRGNT